MTLPLKDIKCPRLVNNFMASDEVQILTVVRFLFELPTVEFSFLYLDHLIVCFKFNLKYRHLLRPPPVVNFWFKMN